MPVDVGSIEATLEVDRDPFQAGLDAAQASAEEFIADPYTATLSIDATEVEAKIAELRAEIESLNSNIVLTSDGGPLAGADGLEALGDEAANTEAELASLGAQVDTTGASFDGLGQLVDEQIDSLGGLGDAAALASDDVGGLSASLVVGTEGLEGFLAQAAAAGPYGGLGAISAGAEAAGVDLDTLLARLEAAGIGFEDFDQAAAMVGVSTTDFAAAMAAASNELNGSDLAGFMQATGQDAVAFDLYMSGAGAATGDLAAATGPLTDEVEKLGGTLQGIQPSTSSFTVWASEAADRLVSMGLAQRNAGGDLVDLDGNLTSTSSLLKNFGIVLDDGSVSSVGFDQALTQFAAGGLTDATGGMEAFLSSQEGVVAGQQAVADATAALERGFAAAAQGELLATAGLTDIDAASAGAAGGILDVSNSLAALGSGGGGGGGGGPSLLDQIGGAFLGAGKDASTLAEAVAALSPVIASTVSVGVGAFLSLGSAALTASAAVGVFGIAAIGDLSGIESAVENAYTQWFQMNDIIQEISPAVQALGGTVTAMLDAITPLVQPAVAAFMEMESAIQKVTVSPAFQQFVSFLGSEMEPMLSSIVGTLGTFAEAFGKMAEVAQPFTDQVASGMQSLANDLDKFASSNGFQEFITWLEQNGPKVGDFISNLAGIIESLWEGFSKVGGAVLPFVDAITKLVDEFVELGPVPEIIAGIVMSIGALGLLAAPVLAIGGALGLLTGAGVAAGVGMAAAGVVIGGAVVGAAAVVGVGVYEMATHWSDIKSAAGDVGDFFENTVPNFFSDSANKINSAYDGIPAKIIEPFADASSWLGKAGDDIEGGFLSSLETASGDVFGWFDNVEGDVLKFFDGAADWLLNIGEDIISGLLNGLEHAWNDVIGWLEDAVKDVVDVFKDILGIFSPSTVMIGVGENITAGLGIGLQSGWENHVAGFLTSSAAQIASAFGGDIAGPTTAGSSGAALVGTLAATPTGGNTAAPFVVNSSPSVVINGADLSNAPAIAQLVKTAIKESHAELLTKIQAGSRGH